MKPENSTTIQPPNQKVVNLYYESDKFKPHSHTLPLEEKHASQQTYSWLLTVAHGLISLLENV